MKKHEDYLDENGRELPSDGIRPLSSTVQWLTEKETEAGVWYNVKEALPSVSVCPHAVRPALTDRDGLQSHSCDKYPGKYWSRTTLGMRGCGIFVGVTGCESVPVR